MNLLTKQEIEALLDGTTPGPWRADGPSYNRIVWSSNENRICFMAHSNGLDDARDVATSNLVAAVHSIARTALDALARLEDAEAAQALVVERAVRGVSDLTHWTGDDDHGTTLVALQEAITAIRALAPASGVEALAALRADVEAHKAHVLRLLPAANRAIAAFAERDDALARLAAAEGRMAALTQERDALKECCLHDMDMTNHHNAAMCPYCSAAASAERVKRDQQLRDLAAELAAAKQREAGLTEAANDHLTALAAYFAGMGSNVEGPKLAQASIAAEARLKSALATVTPPADTGEGRT